MRMNRKLIPAILSLIIFLNFTTFTYAANTKIVGLDDNVKSYVIGDEESGEIFYEKNSEKSMPMASLSKLMTYLLVREAIDEGKITLDLKVEADKRSEELTGWQYSSLGLIEGRQYTIDQLIKGLIAVSGNDCAYLLAKTVSGDENKFANLMNEKAEELGLTSQKYYNASGIETDDNKQNSSSAKDLFNLSKYVIDTYPDILEVSNLDEVVIPELGINKKSTIPLKDSIETIDGLKTGTTEEAGFCLVSTGKLMAIDPNDDFRVIGVVMGADQKDTRDSVMTDLFYYVSRYYSKKNILDTNKLIENIKSISAKPGYIEIYPKNDLDIISKDDSNVYTNIKLDENLKAPIKQGDVLGSIDVNYNDKFYNIELIAKDDVEKASFISRLTRSIEDSVNFLLKVLIAR